MSLFFENFFEFNYTNLEKSETSFDLKKRFEIIFKIFNVKNINELILKIAVLKKEASLNDNLLSLDINFNKESENI